MLTGIHPAMSGLTSKLVLPKGLLPAKSSAHSPVRTPGRKQRKYLPPTPSTPISAPASPLSVTPSSTIQPSIMTTLSQDDLEDNAVDGWVKHFPAGDASEFGHRTTSPWDTQSSSQGTLDLENSVYGGFEEAQSDAWSWATEAARRNRMDVANLAQISSTKVVKGELDSLDDATQIPGIIYRKQALRSSKEVIGIKADPHYLHKELPLDELPNEFDRLPHDYNVNRHLLSDLVHLQFLGPPGPRLSDIRGRIFRLRLKHSTRIGQDKIVWRSQYECNGACQRVREDRRPPEHTGADELRAWAMEQQAAAAKGNTTDDEVSEQTEDSVYESETHTRKHSCRAVLLLEITVAQVGTGQCSLWRLGEEYHPRPRDLDMLQLSPTIRNLLHQSAGVVGMTPDRLLLWYLKQPTEHNRHVKWVNDNCPHRAPKEEHYKQATRLALRRERLDEDPLAAIEILTARHPEAFLAFQHNGTISHPDVPSEDKAPLWCIVAPPFGLENAIRYGIPHGLYMDSSWRNKNEFRAPMTVLATTDEYQRMVPVAVMVSQHGDEEMYTTFLREVVKGIELHAQRLADMTVVPTIKEAMRPQLLENADIVVEDGFSPFFFMIDGDDAERNAIDNVWQNIAFRLCQFHVMQACKWTGLELFGRESGNPRVHRMLDAIRTCQRCPDESEWEQYYQQLEDTIKSIATRAGDDPDEIWERLDSYLTKQWFSDRWRKYCVDFGLPEHAFNDGPFATNNYVENTFRLFDRVMLASRSNKRLDRLVAVIIQLYFPYFEHLPHSTPRPDPKFVHHLFAGLNAWSGDGVKLLAADSHELPPLIRGTLNPVFAVRRQPGSPSVICGKFVKSARWTCSCQYHMRTGKRCLHLWAVTTYELCGPISAFEDRCAKAQKVTRLARDTGIASPSHHAGTAQDEVDDLASYWQCDIIQDLGIDILPTFAEPSRKTQLGPSHDGTQHPIGRRYAFPPSELSPPAKRSESSHDNSSEEDLEMRKPTYTPRGGRPAKVQPLQPTRTKPKASTISKDLRHKKYVSKKQEMEPSGLVNSGNDCFALSLFQVLARSSDWMTAFTQRFAGEHDRNSPEGLFRTICNAIHAKTPEVFPEIRVVMLDLMQHLDDNAGNTQRDPVELLLALINHLDRQSGAGNDFASLMAAQVENRSTCPFCQYIWSNEGTGSLRFTVIPIHPVSEGDHNVDVPSMIDDAVWSDRNRGHRYSRLCPNPTCNREFRDKGNYTCQAPSRLLALNTVWPVETGNPLGVSLSPRITAKPFRIPHRLTWGDNEWFSPNRRHQLQWTIVGAVIKAGTMQSSGHYVALIHVNDLWFSVDDLRVSRIGGTASAFEGGSVPVLLLYERTARTTEDQVSPLGRMERGKSKRKHPPGSLSVKDRERLSKKMRSSVMSSDTPLGPDSLGGRHNPQHVSENRPFAAGSESSGSSKSDSGEEEDFPISPLWIKYTKERPMRPVPFGPIPSLPLLRAPSNEPEWFLRYSLVNWPNKDEKSIVSASGQMKRPARFAQKIHSLTGAVRTRRFWPALDDLERMTSDASWYSTSILRILGLIGQEWVHRRSLGARIRDGVVANTNASPATTFHPQSFLEWDGEQPRMVGDDGNCWPFYWNKSTNWRNERTVSWISTQKNSHFMCIAIFGPQRLVIPFDSSSGSHTLPSIAREWPKFIQGRLDFELEEGWVKPEDNAGWIIAPNNRDTLERLKWVKQTDFDSCGPLTIAACLLIMQGKMPSTVNLSVRSQWSPKDATGLRKDLLALLLSWHADIAERDGSTCWDKLVEFAGDGYRSIVT